MNIDPSRWIKASASNGGSNCVEMRQHDVTVEVRDTKDRGHGPTLSFSPTAFGAWIEAAKKGELDTLN
jgi:hypothetical protein